MAQDQAGIMSLPQPQEGQDPTLTLDDSYGIVSEALNKTSPEAAQMVNSTLDEIIPGLDQLSDEELDIFIQLVQKLYNEPENYAENRANLINGGDLEEEDLPPEYDPDTLSTMLLVLLRARDQRAKAGTAPETASQAPMPEMPMAAMAPPEMMPPQQFARGGIVEAVRMVANSGRNGDTMLAHITPKEARLLRKHGGSGTINPATGLPEYGFFGFLKKAWNVVWKPVKKVLNTKIGALVLNIAATAVMGPLWGPIIASGLTTAARGGEFKDILKSAVTAAAVSYLGSATGPLAGPINNLSRGLGIESQLGQMAMRTGLASAGVGLLTGQSLKDSIKSGVIASGTAVAGSLGRDALFGVKGGQSAPPIEDRTRPGMPESQQGMLSPALSDAAPIPVPGSAPTVGAGPSSVFTQQGPSPFGTSSVAAPVVANASVSTPTPAVSAGTSTGAPVVADAGSSTPYKIPGIMDSMSTMGQGAKQMFGSEPGSFMKGLETMGKGAGDLFMPSGPTTAEVTSSPAYQAAIKANMSPTAAFEAASKELAPNMFRTYGPGAAAGLGVMALSGGFTPTPPPESEMKKEMYGTPGLDLLNADPNKYLVQNLPGVQYDAQGRIIGQGGISNQPTMQDVRVASNYTNAPRYFADGGIASVIQGLRGNFFDRMNAQRGMAPPVMGRFPNMQNFIYHLKNRQEALQGAPQGMGRFNGIQNFVKQRIAKAEAAAASAQAAAAAQAAANASGQRNKFFAANPEKYTVPAPTASQQGGIAALAQGGYPRRTGQISGPGTEKSDSIPAMLSDGEFVMTAKAVRGLGKGSRLEGAKRMYALMHQLETNASRG